MKRKLNILTNIQTALSYFYHWQSQLSIVQWAWMWVFILSISSDTKAKLKTISECQHLTTSISFRAYLCHYFEIFNHQKLIFIQKTYDIQNHSVKTDWKYDILSQKLSHDNLTCWDIARELVLIKAREKVAIKLWWTYCMTK